MQKTENPAIGFSMFQLGDITENALQPALPDGLERIEANRESIRAWLAGAEDAHVLVGYRNPLIDLATRLAADDFGEIPLQAWQAEISNLVELARCDRRRVTLVDIDAMLASPDEFSEHVRERCGAVVRLTPPQALDEQHTPGQLARLTVASALRADENAHAALVELQASSFRLPDPASFSVNEAVAELEQLAGGGVSEHANLEEENELLLLQLHQVQEELEAYFLANKSLERDVDKLRSNSQAHAKKHAAELRNCQAALKQKSIDLETRENDLQAMRQSLSWKLTSPLRAVLGVFVRDR